MAQEQKVRLDVLLVNRGLFETRESAKRAIMAGLVTSDGNLVDKPGTLVRPSIPLHVTEPLHQYVSRGGVKLAHALDTFEVDVSGQVVLDVGASTGGFTDCVLQRHAAYVHAVDVGYGQFAWKLRNDPRVHLLERTNFRHVDATLFTPQPVVAVMDVSFISVKLLFARLFEILGPTSSVVTLIKPQFEAGRENVGKGGIVRNPLVHQRVLLDTAEDAARHGFQVQQSTFSPVEGGDGNIEFFLHLRKGQDLHPAQCTPSTLTDTVVDAWRQLKGQEISLAHS